MCILVSVAASRTQSSFVHGNRADKKHIHALLPLVGRLIVAQSDWSLLFVKDGSVEKHRHVCVCVCVRGGV